MANSLIPLGDNLFYFDLYERGQPWHTAAYLYNGRKKILIETGASTSYERILQALEELYLQPNDLDYVLLTHIHLDHSGGAGLLASAAPKTVFLCHPRAQRHLVDPSRLKQSALAVYGDVMDSMFGAILPISPERVIAQEDGAILDAGDLKLQFFHTPGHAKHHMCIFDPDRAAVFSGDALGIRYVSHSTKWDRDVIFPSASPPDFDPEGVAYTVQKIAALRPKTVLHTHFGPSDADEALTSTLREAELFAKMADTVFHPNLEETEMKAALITHLQRRLLALGVAPAADIEKFGIDLMLNAKGLLYYERKKHGLPL